jgi:hypothetical protein
VGWVVVVAELVADTVALTHAVQRDPHRSRVGDVVVEAVASRPAGHRALLDSVLQATLLGLQQHRHERHLEFEHVLIHLLGPVAPDEPAHRLDAEQHSRIHRPYREFVLPPADRVVGVEHVVEVADVGDGDPAAPHRRQDAVSAASNGWRRSSVLATGSSNASAGTSASLGCGAADSWMQSAPNVDA